MARLARVVCPGCPHHVTQRGNRRQDVFYTEYDYLEFIDLLQSSCAKAGLDVWAYAMMTNHFHLVAVPKTTESLEIAMRECLSTYALSFNRRYGFNGHLWQSRFFSSALETSHMWNAIRYVERNPVRAGMVDKGESYRWSSAPFHCGLRSEDPFISLASPLVGSMENWSEWLATSGSECDVDLLRRNTRTGRPSGPPEFVHLLEQILGRQIVPGPRSKRSGE